MWPSFLNNTCVKASIPYAVLFLVAGLGFQAHNLLSGSKDKQKFSDYQETTAIPISESFWDSPLFIVIIGVVAAILILAILIKVFCLNRSSVKRTEDKTNTEDEKSDSSKRPKISPDLLKV